MTAGVEVSDLQRGDRWRLILAALIPLAAFGLQSAFWAAIQPYVWFLFYPAVFFSSWVGGAAGRVGCHIPVHRAGLVFLHSAAIFVWGA